MTKEEAIKVLNGILHLNYRNFWDEECDEAIDMAIESLSAEYEDYEHATLVDIKEPLKVAVVRCKDCRWWSGSANTSHNNHLCKRALNQNVEYWTRGDDYCSYGERREP